MSKQDDGSEVQKSFGKPTGPDDGVEKEVASDAVTKEGGPTLHHTEEMSTEEKKVVYSTL
jgi:hypothetical protein